MGASIATFSDTISIVKDIVLAACAITGASVAVKGLNRWKAESNWQENKKLAKDLVLKIYKLNDDIAFVRNPVFLSSETQVAEGETNDDTEPNMAQYLKINQAYQRRWDKVTDTKQGIYPLLIEAEVMWGGKIRELFGPIDKQLLDLHYALIEDFEYRNPATSPHAKENLLKECGKRNLILHRRHNGDEFGQELKKHFDALEDYLRNFLGTDRK